MKELLTQLLQAADSADTNADQLNTENLLARRAEFKNFIVILIWDKTASAHKYICAHSTSGKSYLVCMPLTIIELHKDILMLLSEVIADPQAICEGGGYIKNEHGALFCFGESQDFGSFDHKLATKAFGNIKGLFSPG